MAKILWLITIPGYSIWIKSFGSCAQRDITLYFVWPPRWHISRHKFWHSIWHLIRQNSDKYTDMIWHAMCHLIPHIFSHTTWHFVSHIMKCCLAFYLIILTFYLFLRGGKFVVFSICLLPAKSRPMLIKHIKTSLDHGKTSVGYGSTLVWPEDLGYQMLYRTSSDIF